MKIYTKRGDLGQTSLLGGARVPKNCMRIELLGTIDELNSVLGAALSHGNDDDSAARLVRTQRQLFALGAFLARTSETPASELPPMTRWTELLEAEIDLMDAALPKLTNFILPGGSSSGAAIHWARAICRRAERVFFAESMPHGEAAGVYLNRLGDWLFMLARSVNQKANTPEPIWRGKDDRE